MRPVETEKDINIVATIFFIWTKGKNIVTIDVVDFID